MTAPITAIVLAAGAGTRMKDAGAKVLHKLGGRPLLGWVVDAVLQAGSTRVIVVVGHGRAQVEDYLEERYGDRVESVLQPEQRGTGDAVRCALDAMGDDGARCLVVYGDCPLMPAAALRELAAKSDRAGALLGLVTGRLGDPSGYGRILRDDTGQVVAIREDRDCNDVERQVTEVNPGIYLARQSFLRDAVAALGADNAQHEFYLTDIVERAAQTGQVVDTTADMEDLGGVNDHHELSLRDERRRLQLLESLARAGVRIQDPKQVYVDADCTVEPGAHLDAGVHLRGTTIVRAGAKIGVGCVLTDCEVGANATILPYTVATQSQIGEDARVGPFAHLRADTSVGAGSKLGNFTETKKTRIGAHSSIGHLSYVGDGVIGDRVNIGAGTIFCNYDGAHKHTTVLENGVFIGSDSQLIAPVHIGENAYVASGTTVTKDVPSDALAVSRPKQENKLGYAPRLRARQKKK